MTRLQFLRDGDGFCCRKSTTSFLIRKIFPKKIWKLQFGQLVTQYKRSIIPNHNS
jgi:hypothetical protein